MPFDKESIMPAADLPHDMTAALASFQSGQFAVAGQRVARHLERQPDSAHGWHLAGMIAFRMGRLHDAVNHVTRAIDCDPANFEFYCNLAAILRQLGRPFEAVQATEVALKLAPDEAVAHHQHGAALHACNRIQEAEAAYREALRWGPSGVETTNNLALVLQQTGNVEEAIQLYEQSLQRQQFQITPWQHLGELARHGHYRFHADQLRDVVGLQQQANLTAYDAARLEQVVAIDHDCHQRWQQAFEHYRRANELITADRRNHPDASTLAAYGDGIHARQRLYEALSVNSGLATSRPLFVIGMPRSGTTLLESVLVRNGDAAAGGELTIIDEIVRAAIDRHTCGGEISAAMMKTWASAYLTAIEQIDAQAATLVDKMPENFLNIGFIIKLFPNARIVHVRRDPRDVAISCYFHLFQSPSLCWRTCELEHIIEWFGHYESMMRYWREKVSGRWIDVRYEEFVADPKQSTDVLLTKLNLDSAQTPPHAYAARTASSLQVQQQISTGSIGRWQRYRPWIEPLLDRWGDQPSVGGD